MSDKRSDSQSPGQASHHSVISKARASHTPFTDRLRRQNDGLPCAWRNLIEAAPVISFLNTHHESLGGQPLHVAIDSDEGLLRIEQLLGELAP